MVKSPQPNSHTPDKLKEASASKRNRSNPGFLGLRCVLVPYNMVFSASSPSASLENTPSYLSYNAAGFGSTTSSSSTKRLLRSRKTLFSRPLFQTKPSPARPPWWRVPSFACMRSISTMEAVPQQGSRGGRYGWSWNGRAREPPPRRYQPLCFTRRARK